VEPAGRVQIPSWALYLRFKSHFFEQLNREGIGEQRKKKYRKILKRIRRLKIENSQEGVDRFFNYLQESEFTFESRKTDWYIFRKFMKFINPDLKWEYRLKNTERRLPDILTLEEVLRLKDSTKNPRNRAIVSLLFDSGMRTGELVNLKVEDIVFDEEGLLVNINGKTGERRIRIVNTVNSEQALKDWLKYHQFKEDPCSPLFYRLDKNIKEKLTSEGLGKILKEIGKDMNRRIYPYLFRHSRATFLAKYLTEQEMKIYFGWTMGSRMVQTYVHLSCRDLDIKVLELNKKPVDKKEEFRDMIREELLRVLKSL